MNSTAQTELRRIMRSPKHEPPLVYPETAQPQNAVEFAVYENGGTDDYMRVVNPVYSFIPKEAQDDN